MMRSTQDQEASHEVGGAWAPSQPGYDAITNKTILGSDCMMKYAKKA